MNPLNEQDEPVMKSYNNDPNNFQMNMILVRAATFSASLSAHFTQQTSRLVRSRYYFLASKRTQSADESCYEHDDGKRLESAVK